MCGNLLFAAGTNSVALPHDEEDPCTSHRGILFAFLFSVCFIDLFFHFWGFGVFLFSNSFFNYLSQDGQSSSLKR
jgi:hypothetical protein